MNNNIISRLFNKINKGLINLGVRKKLLLVYFLCVLIPTIITNSIFATMMVNSLHNKRVQQIRAAFDILNTNIKKVMEEALYYSNTLYTDQMLNEVLDTDFNGVEDFYSYYDRYLRNRIYQGRYVYSNISRITIYTNNPTIIESDGYKKLNSPETKEWLDKLLKNSRGVIVIPTKEDDDGYVSLIRNLNQFETRSSNSKYIKIAKIDINLSAFVNAINFGIFDGRIYLVDNKNRIVASKNDFKILVGRPFVKFEKSRFLKKNEYIFNERLDYSLVNGWRLIGIFSKAYMLEEVNGAIKYMLIISLISLIAATLLIRLITSSLSNRLELLTRHIKRIKKQNFTVLNCYEGNDEIGNVIKEFNNMTIKLKELIEKEMLSEIQRKTLEVEKKQAEINALQSQINPHFLFNTLESIRMRSVLKNELETAEIIKYLTRTLRRLIYWGNDITTVEEEIAFVEEFLKIQKYRLGDKLSYNIIVDESTKDCLIPKMCIQPIVENACIHGIEKKQDSGVINILVDKDETYLKIRVEDNGIGIPQEKLDELMLNLKSNNYKDNIGLRNVLKRLMLYYNNAVNFKIESGMNTGTTVFIEIPLELPAFVYKI